MKMSAIQLITRGDDAGSCHSANLAIREAAANGILRNISFMACGPYFAEAAEMLGDLPGVALGLHVTLTCEWNEVRWGSVLSSHQVPDLVLSDGSFNQTTMALHGRHADLGQMIAEIQAQLDLARSLGLDISYIDEHMDVGWLPGLRAEIADLAARESLIDARQFQRLPDVPEHRGNDSVDGLIEQLQKAAPGTYVLVAHPGLDACDMRRMYHSPLNPGDVALRRNADRLLLLSPRLRAACAELGIEVIRFPDRRSPDNN